MAQPNLKLVVEAVSLDQAVRAIEGLREAVDAHVEGAFGLQVCYAAEFGNPGALKTVFYVRTVEGRDAAVRAMEGGIEGFAFKDVQAYPDGGLRYRIKATVVTG